MSVGININVHVGAFVTLEKIPTVHQNVSCKHDFSHCAKFDLLNIPQQSSNVSSCRPQFFVIQSGFIYICFHKLVVAFPAISQLCLLFFNALDASVTALAYVGVLGRPAFLVGLADTHAVFLSHSPGNVSNDLP